MKKLMTVCAGLIATAAFAQTETHNDLGWAGDADYWDTSSHALVTTDVQRADVDGGVEFRSFFEDYYIVPVDFSTYRLGCCVIVY